MKSNDPITQIWDYAAPFIAAGQIERSFIEKLCRFGLTYKPRWLENMKASVDEEVARPRAHWELELRILEISAMELGLLHALRKLPQPYKIADLKKHVSPQHRLNEVLCDFEKRGWITVERGQHGKLRAVRALNLPEVFDENQ